jgi:hypothetical protein
MKKYFNFNHLILIVLFIVSLGFRLYGLDWDQGQHLHPDERFLTMVVNDIRLPRHIFDYFNTAISPLNPYNYPSYQFFVYGTFPLFLIRFLAQNLNLADYGHIHLLGRAVSALFDSANIILLYYLSCHLISDRRHRLFPGLIYTFMVLPLQLSHFFAVDPYLNTFLLAVLVFLVYFYQSSHFGFLFLASVSYGLAFASKITAIYFAPIFGIFLLMFWFQNRSFLKTFVLTLVSILVVFATFRLFQPYAFVGLVSPNPSFIKSLSELAHQSRPDIYFPPAVQWISKTRLLFPLQNLVLWGLGLPMFFLLVLSFFSSLGRLSQKLSSSSQRVILIVWFWLGLLFLVQGSQFAHTMRYFLPMYPLLALLVGYYLQQSSRFRLLQKLLIITHCAVGLIFLSIYSRPHSRVQASDYIYQHLPAGSMITNEYWDDTLPLNLPGYDSAIYQGDMLPLYDPDTSEKWDKINPILSQADYLIMSSNRLWGSIPAVPDQYPQTSVFYQRLFDQQTPYRLLARFVSYPGIPLPWLKSCYYFGPSNYPYHLNSNHWYESDSTCRYPGIYLRDDTAEEAFTVYDHPQVLIFQNTSKKL